MKPSEILNTLRTYREANIPLMIWGQMGVGKSDTVRAFAKEIEQTEGGGKVFDLRLATVDPVDLRGVPMFDSAESVARWMQIEGMLPSGKDRNAILFLDEIVSAAPSVQAAAYQLVLDRKIGEYSLPEDTYVVAGGNIAADKGVTYSMPGPLRNRFGHVTYEINVDDWLDWAMNNDIHPDILAFISYSKSLHKFSGDSEDNAFPTPRTWAFASKLMKVGEKNNSAETNIKNNVAGVIGVGMSSDFFNFRLLKKHLPNLDDVFSGKVKDLSEKAKEEISIHYSLIFTGLSELFRMFDEKDNNIKIAHSNFLRFVMSNCKKEFLSVFLSNIGKNKSEMFGDKYLEQDLFKKICDTELKYLVV